MVSTLRTPHASQSHREELIMSGRCTFCGDPREGAFYIGDTTECADCHTQFMSDLAQDAWDGREDN